MYLSSTSPHVGGPRDERGWWSEEGHGAQFARWEPRWHDNHMLSIFISRQLVAVGACRSVGGSHNTISYLSNSLQVLHIFHIVSKQKTPHWQHKVQSETLECQLQSLSEIKLTFESLRCKNAWPVSMSARHPTEFNNSLPELLCSDDDSGNEDVLDMEYTEAEAENLKRNAEVRNIPLLHNQCGLLILVNCALQIHWSKRSVPQLFYQTFLAVLIIKSIQ